ncbi:hypothetical protein Nepgr_022839 [Nepenthes gracilis]|uniref:Uncharacterized protein n=1 Tax=Nepenthes gracilis TaxID=150966 RepID=A0AAD3XX64_NEPGR|nr:hypothetical protein Nepgr_022839 [Nepenthes gracilis]
MCGGPRLVSLIPLFDTLPIEIVLQAARSCYVHNMIGFVVLPLEHLVLLVPSLEPHLDIGTVRMLRILMELGNGRDAFAFVSSSLKPWLLFCAAICEWSLIHLLYWALCLLAAMGGGL